jgi:hypothetical protein
VNRLLANPQRQLNLANDASLRIALQRFGREERKTRCDDIIRASPIAAASYAALAIRIEECSMTQRNAPATGSSDGSQLISHGAHDSAGLAQRIEAIRARLQAGGDLPGASVEQQLGVLDRFAATELGRFLLEHRGLNAYWTHRVVTYQAGSAPTDPATAFQNHLLETLPAVLATRERFGIFQQQLQGLLRPGAVLASIPCGLMGELLLLDYAGLDDIKLIGIDLDTAALDAAQTLAQQRDLAGRVTLRHEDAWTCGLNNEVDVLTSNGLNIYEADDARVTALYRLFFAALKPGGTLVTSFMTPPPVLSPQSPWHMAAVDQQALALQQLLFVRIIEAKWSAFRTYEQTREQLEAAGFSSIEFIDDRARMFPTVVARKA